MLNLVPINAVPLTITEVIVLRSLNVVKYWQNHGMSVA